MQSSNTPGISITVAPLPSGCDSCWGVTLPCGSRTADLTRGFAGRPRRGPRRPTCRRSRRRWPGPPTTGALADQRVEVAERAGHAAVLERGARVLAVVLEVEVEADLVAQGRVGPHERGVPLAQVDDVLERDDRADELVVAVDALQRRDGQHLAVIEDAAPQGPRGLLQPCEAAVLDQQDAAALRTDVEQALDPVGGAAAEAAVDQPPGVGGDQVRLDVLRERVDIHGVIVSIPPR